MHVEFTLTSACPMLCRYCPQDKYIRAYAQRPGPRATSLEDYKTMLSHIDHLTENIDFSGYTEPLVNPFWYSIFQHTIEQGYFLTLYSTLYQATMEDIEKLTSLDIGKIYIHLTNHKPDMSINRYLITRSKARHLDLTFVYFEEDGMNIGPQFSDQISCDKWTVHSRAGNVDVNPRYIRGSVLCCEERYMCNIVLPNGDVHICCMDFPLQYMIGIRVSPLSRQKSGLYLVHGISLHGFWV